MYSCAISDCHLIQVLTHVQWSTMFSCDIHNENSIETEIRDTIYKYVLQSHNLTHWLLLMIMFVCLDMI